MKKEELRDLSCNFKYLVTLMLNYYPEMRLTHADLATHEWVTKGKVASSKEVRDEFILRRINIEHDKKQKIAEQRTNKQPTHRRSVLRQCGADGS